MAISDQGGVRRRGVLAGFLVGAALPWAPTAKLAKSSVLGAVEPLTVDMVATAKVLDTVVSLDKALQHEI